MNNVEFYTEIVNRGVYTMFNGLRDALFAKLAIDSHIPLAHAKLDEVLTECEYLTDIQKDFIKESLSEDARFRIHKCSSDGLQLYYFVNTSAEREEDSEVAAHMQELVCGPKQKIKAASAIALFEKHPTIYPMKYPVVIKHELTHAAIEFVIGTTEELLSYYFSEDQTVKNFIEFLCDIVPYLANPSKKENGVGKFVHDSMEFFGYDAEEGEAASFLKDVNEAIDNLNSELPLQTEHSFEEFKTLKDKYLFLLTKMDDETRSDALGIRKIMYYDKERATRWKDAIKTVLLDGDVDEQTNLAIDILERFYENMTKDDDENCNDGEWRINNCTLT